MSFRAFLLVPLLASGVLVPTASADRLFVAGDGGRVMQADTLDGEFEDFSLVPCGIVVALASDSQRLFTLDGFGQLNVFDIDDGTWQNVFWVNVGVTRSIAAARGSVFVGAEDGTVARVDPQTGDVLGLRLVPAGVNALLAHGSFLYAAGADGAIYRAPITGGDFTYFTCFCFSNLQALAIVGGDLVASDANGIVARVDLDTGWVVSAFWVGLTGAMTSLDGILLFYYDGGTIPFVDAQTGAMLGGSFHSPADVNAMLVVPEPPAPGPHQRIARPTSTPKKP